MQAVFICLPEYNLRLRIIYAFHAADSLFSSVIDSVKFADSAYCDSKLCVAVCNIQRAAGSCNCVIVSKCPFIQRISECIGTASCHSLCSGYTVRCSFAFSKVGAGNFVIGQSDTVVFLLSAAGSQDHAALSDGQFTVFEFDLVIALISSSAGSYGIFAGIYTVVIAQGIRYSIIPDQAGHGCGQAFKGLSVIGFVLIVCFDFGGSLADSHSVGSVGHIIVALYRVAGRSDGIAADILTVLTAQCVCDSVLAYQAADLRSQFGISLAVNLALCFCSNSCSCLADSQLVRNIHHIVVTLNRVAGWCNVIFPGIFSGGAAQRVTDGIHCVAVLQAVDCRRQDWIIFTVYFCLGICSYSGCRPGNGQIRGAEDYIIVALYRFTCRRNGIFTDILAFRTAQCIADDVSRIAILQPGNSRCKGSIIFAVNFGLGIRGNGSCRPGNGQVCGNINYVVVALFCVACRCDRIFADIRTCCAGQRIVYNVFRITVLQSGYGRRQGRIIRTVHLCLCACSNGSRRFIDCQCTGLVGYSIVALYRFTGRCNGVSICIFTFGAAETVSNRITADRSADEGVKCGIRIPVSLCFVICCYSHRCSGNSQFSGFRINSKLCCHVVTVCILHDCRTGNIRRISTGIRAARACAQAAYRIGNTVEHEVQAIFIRCSEYNIRSRIIHAFHTADSFFASVIYSACIAAAADRNCKLCFTIKDVQ